METYKAVSRIGKKNKNLVVIRMFFSSQITKVFM